MTFVGGGDAALDSDPACSFASPVPYALFQFSYTWRGWFLKFSFPAACVSSYAVCPITLCWH